jgi:hypothetical protein
MELAARVDTWSLVTYVLRTGRVDSQP